MSALIYKTKINIESTNSIVDFATKGGEHIEVWDRYLTIEGKPAYHIGNVCDTCTFFFERLNGANQNVSSDEFAQYLREGLHLPDAKLIELVGKIMPSGEYAVLFLETAPKIIHLGSTDDYFSNEQVMLWGIDGFWGFPHHPKIEYYRCSPQKIKNKEQLFEFVVPIFPKNWLDKKTVSEYMSRLKSGDTPTALAISVLDVKQPAVWSGKPEITTHWCLAHYLLDGHHKVFAASQTNTPITMLTFLARKQSIATPDEIELTINVLEKTKTG